MDTHQAGLSWKIIWHKYEGFKRAYGNFDPKNIIRNKLKIKATISNVQAFLRVQEEFGSFANYMWSFVDYKPIQTNLHHSAKMSSHTKLSDSMSVDLKKQGFKFVGSTICYAFMQGIGMTNDHHTKCFRHKEIKRMGKNILKNLEK